jgi:hypothetical protein
LAKELVDELVETAVVERWHRQPNNRTTLARYPRRAHSFNNSDKLACFWLVTRQSIPNSCGYKTHPSNSIPTALRRKTRRWCLGDKKMSRRQERGRWNLA